MREESGPSSKTDAGDPRVIFFDERAAAWEERCYPPEARARLQELVPLFGVRPGTAVLDLGAGTGVLAPYLRALLTPAGTLISIDISFEMARRAAQKPDYSKGAAVRATAMHLPLQSDCVDTVVCFAAFPHFSDKAGAVAEMFRVLRPGGNLVIAHLLSRSELSRHHGGHSAVADDKLPDDRGMRALFVAAGFPAPEIVDRPGRYLASAEKP